MKRQQRTKGAIVEIRLPDNSFTYARILSRPSFAFYDLRLSHSLNELATLLDKPILTRLNVARTAVTQGRWIKRKEKIVLEEPLTKEVQKYVWTRFNPSFFQLIEEDGKIRKSNFEECKQLYSSTLLSPALAENVILDYFNGGDLLEKKYGKGSLKYLVEEQKSNSNLI